MKSVIKKFNELSSQVGCYTSISTFMATRASKTHLTGYEIVDHVLNIHIGRMYKPTRALLVKHIVSVMIQVLADGHTTHIDGVVVHGNDAMQMLAIHPGRVVKLSSFLEWVVALESAEKPDYVDLVATLHSQPKWYTPINHLPLDSAVPANAVSVKLKLSQHTAVTALEIAAREILYHVLNGARCVYLHSDYHEEFIQGSYFSEIIPSLEAIANGKAEGSPVSPVDMDDIMARTRYMIDCINSGHFANLPIRSAFAAEGVDDDGYALMYVDNGHEKIYVTGEVDGVQIIQSTRKSPSVEMLLMAIQLIAERSTATELIYLHDEHMQLICPDGISLVELIRGIWDNENDVANERLVKIERTTAPSRSVDATNEPLHGHQVEVSLSECIRAYFNHCVTNSLLVSSGDVMDDVYVLSTLFQNDIGFFGALEEMFEPNEEEADMIKRAKSLVTVQAASKLTIAKTVALFMAVLKDAGIA